MPPVEALANVEARFVFHSSDGERLRRLVELISEGRTKVLVDRKSRWRGRSGGLDGTNHRKVDIGLSHSDPQVFRVGPNGTACRGRDRPAAALYAGLQELLPICLDCARKLYCICGYKSPILR